MPLLGGFLFSIFYFFVVLCWMPSLLGCILPQKAHSPYNLSRPTGEFRQLHFFATVQKENSVHQHLAPVIASSQEDKVGAFSRPCPSCHQSHPFVDDPGLAHTALAGIHEAASKEALRSFQTLRALRPPISAVREA